MTRGRPDFIPREQFRAWLKPARMNEFCLIDGILPSSFIARCARLGRPLPSVKVKGTTALAHRLLDLVARARADGVAVTPTAAMRLASNLAALDAQIAARCQLRDKLDNEITFERHRLGLALASTELTGATMLTEAEIVRSAQPLSQANYSGVYFLIHGEAVVYVGQSVNVITRIATHQTEGRKTFDRYAYVPCPPHLLDTMESLYIHALRPPLNGRFGKSGTPYAPLSLDMVQNLAFPTYDARTVAQPLFTGVSS